MKALRRRKRKIHWFSGFFVAAFVCFISITLIRMQIDVATKQRDLAALEQKIQKQQIYNDETARMLEGEDEEQYIERIARDKLGYAYPDEIVFFDRAGD